MSKYESCSYCKCKACDFCVVGDDGQTAIDQQKDRDSLADAATASTLAAGAALVVMVAMSTTLRV